MRKKLRLRELITRAKSGDSEAMNQVVQRFTPVVKKYSRRLGYNEACSDLVLWIVSAIHRYRPNTTWGRDELERYFTRKDVDQG